MTSSFTSVSNRTSAKETEKSSAELSFPTILSLQDLDVSLPQDVYNHLVKQYSVMDQRAPEQENSCAAQTTPLESSHLNNILQHMKTSPAESCCRANLILSSVDEVVEGLTLELVHTNSNEQSDRNYTITQHETLPDVVMVRATNNRETHDFSLSSVPFQEGSIFPPCNWSSKRRDKGWPMTHRAIVVDRFCGEAVLRGANIFVKGILCADVGINKGEHVAVYADLKDENSKPCPRGLALDSYNGRCVFVGLGSSSCKRSEYFSQKSGVGVIMKKIAGTPQPSFNGILETKMILQNLPSALVAHALNPQKGDVILDMCCAPGGKTSHLASLVCNDAFIIACDKSRKKIISTRALFRRMGASCIVPLAVDSTKLLLGLEDLEKWKSPNDIIDSAIASQKDGLLDVKGFYPDSFDRILLDPPCSALGLRPKLHIEGQTLQDLTKHSVYQKKFIRNAIPLLKVGGIMTYSTCTINASENEEMVAFILSNFPNMRLVPISPDSLGLPGLPNVGLSDEERQMVRRFDPCDKIDTMGFFVAKFEKYEIRI